MAKAAAATSKKTQLEIPLLSAHWRDLVVINYVVNPVLLKPLVPKDIELDYFRGKTYISLVGFLFKNTKLFGLMPLWPMQTFEEINLRFYVRKKVGNEIRRAVCFVREIVPFAPIAWGARVLYNEPYVTCPTQHGVSLNEKSKDSSVRRLSFEWKTGKRWIGFNAQTKGKLLKLGKKSKEEFILEHYWGYTPQKDGSVKEYRVRHEPWLFWKTNRVYVDKAVGDFYGGKFKKVLSSRPDSAFVAEGSAVSIYPSRNSKG